METLAIALVVAMVAAVGLLAAHRLPRDGGTGPDYLWWRRIDTRYADPTIRGRGEWVRRVEPPPVPFDWEAESLNDDAR